MSIQWWSDSFQEREFYSRWKGVLCALCLLSNALFSSVAQQSSPSNQGTINFVNRVTTDGILAPVYDAAGELLNGSKYKAQLYVGRNKSDLSPVGSASPFRTGNAAGFISAVTINVPIEGGTKVWVQVVAWDSSLGENPLAIVATSPKSVGASAVFEISLGNGVVGNAPPTLPATLKGLTSFSLGNVAETGFGDITISGSIWFANQVSGAFSAPVFGEDRLTLLEGDAYRAQLFLFTGAGWTSVGDPVPFAPIGSGVNAGFWTGQTRTIFGKSAGQVVNLQVRAWAVSDGESYEGALNKGGRVGASESFQATLELVQNPPVPSPSLAKLKPFALSAKGVVDEFSWLDFTARTGGMDDLRVYDVDDQTPLAGPNYVVQVFGGASVDNLKPLTDLMPLGTGENAGKWNGGLVALAGSSPGQEITLVLRCWNRNIASTWEDGSRVDGFRAQSEVVRVRTGGLGVSPGHLKGIRSFAIRQSFVRAGTIDFASRQVGSFSAPVVDVDGKTLLSGSGYAAQLYAGPDVGSMIPIGNPVAFRTESGAGHWFPGTQLIPGVKAGEEAWVQVRVWDAVGAGSYSEAEHLGLRVGRSRLFSVITGNVGEPPTLPAALSGLQPFGLIAEQRVVVQAEPGFNMMGLALTRGENRVVEVLPNVPPGTRLYRWDNFTQTYSVNTFEFGAWEYPREILSPHEGVILLNPQRGVVDVEVKGIPQSEVRLLSRVPGFYLLQAGAIQSKRIEDFVSFPLKDGDAFYRWIANAYKPGVLTLGSWVGEQPTWKAGEAAWVRLVSGE